MKFFKGLFIISMIIFIFSSLSNTTYAKEATISNETHKLLSSIIDGSYKPSKTKINSEKSFSWSTEIISENKKKTTTFHTLTSKVVTFHTTRDGILPRKHIKHIAEYKTVENGKENIQYGLLNDIRASVTDSTITKQIQAWEKIQPKESLQLGTWIPTTILFVWLFFCFALMIWGSNRYSKPNIAEVNYYQ